MSLLLFYPIACFVFFLVSLFVLLVLGIMPPEWSKKEAVLTCLAWSLAWPLFVLVFPLILIVIIFDDWRKQ